MPRAIRDQAEDFYRHFSTLLRRYQFRDRDRVCCHGISVSQCYALEMLDQHGPLSMGELAEMLVLEISTLTRLVDSLVEADLCTRTADERDKRVRRVKMTAAGQGRVRTVQSELVDEYERVLRAVPSESRDAVVAAVSHLLDAFENRRR